MPRTARPGPASSRGLRADAAPDVEDDARAQPVAHLPVAGGVEREQRVGGRALHRALAGEAGHAPGAYGRQRRAPRFTPPCDVRFLDHDPTPARARVSNACTRSHRATTARSPSSGDIAGEAGLERVSILAWRDLDDPEAGGSEVHAANVASLWAEAGIEVTMRTSYAAGHPMVSWRDGYRVIRKAGRYMVFPRAAFSEMMGWHGGRDGLVEIWNGMPFFSPLWARTAHVTWLHHVHAEMWQMTLPPRLAAFGELVESRVAPPIYRRTPIVTLSESSKQRAGPRPRVQGRPGHGRARPGIDPQFSPGGEKSPTPLVVAVGRLVPVKRFDMLDRRAGRAEAASSRARAP